MAQWESSSLVFESMSPISRKSKHLQAGRLTKNLTESPGETSPWCCVSEGLVAGQTLMGRLKACV